VPSDQFLLIVPGLAVLLSVLLVAAVALRHAWQRRQFNPALALADLRRDNDADAAAAIEAFVEGVSSEPVGGTRLPTPSDALPTPHSQGSDLTCARLENPRTWDRAVREESERNARFGRPVTVVVAALPRLDDLANRLGRDVADRVISETARVLRSQGRAVDRVALLGDATFGVLLPETDEVRARNYIERARADADAWLEAAGLTIRLSLGWASPPEHGDVLAASAVARQRMHDATRVRARPATSGDRRDRSEAG
jgi:diguanylate cyclase (GGDEF)-like protein